MRIIYLLVTILMYSLSTKAQIQSIDISAPGESNNYGGVKFYDPSMIGQKNTTILTYADVDGSPFWNEKWAPALLFLKSGSVVKVNYVKLNLFTSDVLYIDNFGVALEAKAGMVQKMIFINEKDTTKALTVFEAFPDKKVDNGYSYCKVLADGKYKLLQIQKSFLRTVPSSVLSDKKTESSFYTKSSYAIAYEGALFPISALNHTNITAIVYPDKDTEQWLKDNKNNLKKELEVVAFLNYCNVQKK